MGVSRFLWEDFLRMQHENLFPVVMDSPALDERTPGEILREAGRREIERAAAHGDPVAGLNRFKDREMFRIDLRHITHRIDFRRFSEELSELSEVVVQQAAQLAEAKVTDRFGAPALASGRPCRWTVCALGKFGGRELGFGSDIEMIFVYEAEGATGGPDVIENSRFFREFVVEFTRTIATRSESIFEIDLRLRPYGNAGPLASSLGAFESYYSDAGAARQFERMAMVKLRPVAGDPDLGMEIDRLRNDFVYSAAPVDPENVLHLRDRQAAELVSRGAVNAKYSKGGLVDVEYFVQMQQIVAGHLDPSVHATNTLAAIDSLDRGGHIPPDQARDVNETYGFIRRFIDALRVVRGNARDLTIPSQDSREFVYLAQRLQFPSPQQLEEAIRVHMGFAGSLLEDRPSA
jgi:glutamate-ammonia-ligase adenylyltransferase